ncbi:hypothetical protein BJ684DRAFT_22159 [Piptocephalis cylindrospora]|uniref:Uncharacterized protein n=1 Tax=Piptocephalis cylindrospora TaxID=1907219 RepID=A0A4P9Y0J1_9FUNG|nr:hypothetical protein BJ684DRAFT_22159 [Piptocephalis cylindrospora]|eukprot:RKP11290.1 hypothetical protein BJ684DRAFT_22159 [Piptocephalis cylindrospora]
MVDERVNTHQRRDTPGGRSFFEKAMLCTVASYKSSPACLVGRPLIASIRRAHDLTITLIEKASESMRDDLISSAACLIITFIRDDVGFSVGSDTQHTMHLLSIQKLAKLFMKYYKDLLQFVYDNSDPLIHMALHTLVPSTGAKRYRILPPVLLLLRKQIHNVRKILRINIRDGLIYIMLLCFPYNVTTKKDQTDQAYQDQLKLIVREALRKADPITFENLDRG